MNYWAAPDLIVYLPIKNYQPEELISRVSVALNVSYADMTGRGKKRELVEARHISMWIIRNYTNSSLKYIGRLFDRDHTAVIYAINLVNDLLKVDTGFINKVMSVRKIL